MWQVVPQKPSEEPWISARSGAACSLMDGGDTLVTLWGVGRYGPVGHDEMTAFNVYRCIGAKIAAKAGNAGDGGQVSKYLGFFGVAAAGGRNEM